MAASDAGRAYVDRLKLAVDVRLIDNAGKWPALAARADQIVERLKASAATRQRVFDELSSEERLLHAVAQALGGKLDEREARAVHDSKAYTDRDVPFVAIVLASRGIDSPRALDTYTLALLEPLSEPLAKSLQLAFERGFPPTQAHRLGAAVTAKVVARWPDSKWSKVVGALAGDDDGLAGLAIDEPLLVASAGSRVIEAIAKRPDRHERLLGRLGDGNADEVTARLDLIAQSIAWRVPLPKGPIGSAIARVNAEARDAAAVSAATIAAIGAGDITAARKLCRAPANADVETTVARTLAMLGGDVAEVRSLWSLVPDGETTSPIVAANAALILLELGDRQRLRELAVPLTSVRATACGRILLARVYLGAGQRELADDVLAADDSPVARVLKARSRAAVDRAGALAELKLLVEMFPGWWEARLRLGLVHAATDPKQALAVLETEALTGWRDSAVLGPPETARAAARLACGELRRRAGDGAGAAKAIREALERAPASPLVARQAAVLAVALRDSELANDARKRLEAVTPGARVVERLAGALKELAGDRVGAIAHYRAAGSWDRVVVLADLEARESGSFGLPAAFDVEDTTSIAALHAAAVAVQHTDPALAARALERAYQRRSDHRGLLEDLVAARIECARVAIADRDVTALMEAERDLGRLRERVRGNPALERAHAAVAVAIAMRSVRDGDLEAARARLTQLDGDRAGGASPVVSLHALALAIRALDIEAARAWLDETPAGDHRELLAALLADLLGDTAAVEASLPRLVAAPGFVGCAARLLQLLYRRDTHALASWYFDRPDELKLLGSEAALFVTYELAHAPAADRPPHARLAAALEDAAAAYDPDAARRARLVALALRASAEPPEPIALDAIDLGQLEHTAERDLAVGLVAFETRRRRNARDAKGAEAALDRLVQLVRPAGALGILARSSIEAAAEAAAAAWRGKPDDATALQTALATLLRRAINYELAAHPHEECRTAWRAAIGVLGSVLVGDRAWRALSARRERVYKVASHELASARDACGRRVADILSELAKMHAARGAGPQAAGRLDEVRQLIASETAIARSVQTVIASDAGVRAAVPLAIGPLGIDLLGRRAEAIAALASVASDSEVATEAADVRGILVGALLDGWLALHEGRFDVAEQVVRKRISAVGRIEPDASSLLAAVFVRRIHETLDDDDLLAAADIAAGWARLDVAHGMPEPLAVEIVALCDRLYNRYRLGRPRRLLQQLARHGSPLLREHEAALIARHLDDAGESGGGLEAIELCVAAIALAPDDDLRTGLRRRVAAALGAAQKPRDVDAVLDKLRAAPDPLQVAAALLAAQLRRSDLGDDALASVVDLEMRIEALRQAHELARTAGLSVREVAQRLAALHERLAGAYQRGGNEGEAARHDRRALAYRNWSQP